MYILISTNLNSAYFCEDNIWISILELAKSHGWQPKGSRYDISFELDENIADEDDDMMKLFTWVSLNSRFINWDGNYIEKENQIVTERDAFNLMNSLKNSFIDEKFMEFLMGGSFRIKAY